jgi:hypothetical protein
LSAEAGADLSGAALTLPARSTTLWSVGPLLRKLRAAVRHQLLVPVLERLDATDRKLDHLEHRMDDLQVLIEQVSARLSARTETMLAGVESEGRIARRLEELERQLGAR